MLYLALKAKRWDTQAFERAKFNTAPLYERTADIPIDGYKIKVAGRRNGNMSFSDLDQKSGPFPD